MEDGEKDMDVVVQAAAPRLDHAKTSANEQKVFLSGNHTDFGTPEIKQILREAGIRYFIKTGDFLGWSRSQP